MLAFIEIIINKNQIETGKNSLNLIRNSILSQLC